MIFALMRSPSLFIWMPSVERSGHFPGLLTPLIFDWHGGWLVWGADSASYMVACHRCGWLCSEGDWGLVDVWKAPVLMNKDTQKTSEGVELLRIHVQAALQSGPKKTRKRQKRTCESLFAHTHVSIVVVSWSGAVGNGLWTHCAAVVSWGGDDSSFIGNQTMTSQRLNVFCFFKYSPNEPYSFGEAGVFPVKTQTFKNPRKDTRSQMLTCTKKLHYDQRLVSILTLHNDHCVSQENREVRRT